MNIEHLGSKTAEQLVKRNLVHNLADLYALSVDDILTLEGFAQRSARQLHDAIHNTKQPRLDRFVYALGIPHVGRRVARQLAQEFGSLDKLAGADHNQIEKIDGIGTEIAESVTRFFTDKNNQKGLERLRRSGLKVESMTKQSRQPLKGKNFVFTGTLASFTRDSAKERVEYLGARATTSVSKQTDYVVVGENPGSKRDEAKKLGIRCLKEEDFLKMINTDS